FLFLLLAHARQFLQLALARQFLHSRQIADLVRAPDQRNSFRSQALNPKQFQHGGTILLQKFSVKLELALAADFLDVLRHALSNARNFHQLLGVRGELFKLLRLALDSWRGIPIRPDTEGIIAVVFHWFGGLVKNPSYCFVVHASVFLVRSGQKRIVSLSPPSSPNSRRH